jgi:hypothetical protein
MGRNGGQNERIDIVLPAGFDEDSTESAGYLRVELNRVNRPKGPYIVLCGPARDL